MIPIVRPIEGFALQIPARHPIQVWLMAGLVAAGFFQLTEDQTPQSALAMSHQMFITQCVAMIFGGVLCLLSAIVVKRQPWVALGLSLGGMITLSVVWGYYVSLVATHQPNWVSSPSFWFFVALCGGTCHRVVQLSRVALRIRSEAKK